MNKGGSMKHSLNKQINVTILGAGLSGIALAYFIQENPNIDHIDIIEKESSSGGLCRSIHKDGYVYDIGPHILFSKDKEMLDLMLSVLDEKNDLKRSNQIIYKGHYVQYPFENDLSKLPDEDKKYCVTAFESNPYRNYQADNMLQFFLKTFGEGITNTYLRPYNEKIWKYDPSFMDTQMVERIPQPTDDEIRRSAAGETVDGYVHQLYFHFPRYGGIESVVRGFESRLSDKCTIHLNHYVESVSKIGNRYKVVSGGTSYTSDLLISTIPIQELIESYAASTDTLKNCAEQLRYNSILIAFVRTGKDLCGDNFAFMNPEKDVIFHRISKMDFLGEQYHISDGATYMVEITFREGDYIDAQTDSEILGRIKKGMVYLGFANNDSEISLIDLTRHKYAYVIYDINHKSNMATIRNFFDNEGILLNGRFGNFEYWNMDRVLREAKTMSENIERDCNDNY